MKTRNKLASVILTMALLIGTSLSAFASNLNGPFLFRDAALTKQYPQHAQACFRQVLTEDAGGNKTELKVYVKDVSYFFITGRITSMTIDGKTRVPDKNQVITFPAVSNKLISKDGAVKVSLELSYLGHKHDVRNVYLDVIN
ncbi:hypothetical protein GCWU000341_01014 [Oribacterium sp. oral taxon 078 str. F0262]|uniref:hypothetical protein n=1 Tax=Oribacterium sp. oral taxon 078 TaxID=652706 RepID=UPI0001BCC451|nr:hypothetical protein [Oribacterium sp. oral taxon 078]EFE91830.1 hypothetical protein GCWU000341_01014 [Oribacterium sp. oral taxon 078 str. F0262]